MVTELNGSAKRNIALLENQIRTVNELIDKAGKTANVLQKEKEKHDLASRVYTSLSRSRPLALDVEEDNPEEPVPDMGIVSVFSVLSRVRRLALMASMMRMK